MVETVVSPLPGIARAAVEAAVMGLTPPPPPLLDAALEAPAPCFVTITIGDDDTLRGCVGTVVPVLPRLPLEVQRNALAAAFNDPRMHPVTAPELPHLHYKVDVLGEMTAVAHWSEIDPTRYGLVLRHPLTSALLLPDIAGIETPEQQVEALLRKAGLDGWDDGIALWRFPVVRHREAPRVCSATS